MGHVRTGPLPATRKWNRVVELIAGGAAAGQVATATITAAEKGLKAVADDPGVLEALWLLIRIPLAARGPDFAAALRDIGLDVTAPPDLLDVAVAYSSAVDAAGTRRTDLGEMAQTAGVETINGTVGVRTQSLFGTGPDDVRRGFAALATPARFGTLARRWFATFSYKCLDYFLSKALPDQTGGDNRFPTVAAQNRFTDALRTHCDEAAGIVERFAADWFSLHRFQSKGDITRDEARGFLAHAVATKLTGEFRRREGAAWCLSG